MYINIFQRSAGWCSQRYRTLEVVAVAATFSKIRPTLESPGILVFIQSFCIFLKLRAPCAHCLR